MSWTPTKLTREQLEERRLEAVRLLRQGKLKQSEIARKLGVSRAAVNQWKHQLSEKGRKALQRHNSSGRPCKLSAEQKKQLWRMLAQGAIKSGFETERWTLSRIRTVIKREFKVMYNSSHLSFLLRQHGYSWQQPATQARERDEDLIRAWLEQDWPRIKKILANKA